MLEPVIVIATIILIFFHGSDSEHFSGLITTIFNDDILYVY
jgi:hypothetical protein